MIIRISRPLGIIIFSLTVQNECIHIVLFAEPFYKLILFSDPTSCRLGDMIIKTDFDILHVFEALHFPLYLKHSAHNLSNMTYYFPLLKSSDALLHVLS